VENACRRVRLKDELQRTRDARVGNRKRGSPGKKKGGKEKRPKLQKDRLAKAGKKKQLADLFEKARGRLICARNGRVERTRQ